MTTLNNALYFSQQIRACVALCYANFGLKVDDLMARAGTAAITVLRQQFPKARHLTFFCGSGSNGGMGYILARLAHEQGYEVVVNQYKSLENLTEPTRGLASQALAVGVNFQYLDEPIDSDTDVIIDAMLGIGLYQEVQGPLKAAINQLNDSEAPIISLDIPSGLNSDTGQIMGACVKATLTITFIALKFGMLTLDGPDQCGQIIEDSLRLTPFLESVTPAATLLSSQLFQSLLPPRRLNSHKNQFGHVLIIGGGIGMPGAVFIAAQAALRVGAGLVTIATHPEHAALALSSLPEAMVYGIADLVALRPLLQKATVCVIGPGLGNDLWAQQLFNLAIAAQLPMIIDASALGLLATNPQYDDNWVLTPHAGEAASLLDSTIQAIQADRHKAIINLQQRYGGHIVLKGVGSLIQSEKGFTYLCRAGNPGMASPGMGDALSGVIAGLIAQGVSLSDAACWGVLMHAQAADLAARQQGERGLLASDLMPYLRQLVNHDEQRV